MLLTKCKNARQILAQQQKSPRNLRLALKLSLRCSCRVVAILPLVIQHAKLFVRALGSIPFSLLPQLTFLHPVLCIIKKSSSAHVCRISDDVSALPAPVVLKQVSLIFKVDADGVVGLDREGSILLQTPLQIRENKKNKTKHCKQFSKDKAHQHCPKASYHHRCHSVP
jgi:hypothetical protein